MGQCGWMLVMSGNDDGREVEALRRGLPNRDPTLTLTFRSLRLCLLGGRSHGDGRAFMMGVQVEQIVCLRTKEVI